DEQRGSDTAELHRRTRDRIVDLADVRDLGETRARQNRARRVVRSRLEALAQLVRKLLRYPVHGDRAEPLAVVKPQAAISDMTAAVRLLQDRVEHRRELAGRGVDDLQDRGGRGLLLQGLARLADEPRVLHRDHRLRGEAFQDRDLFLAEWSDFQPGSDDPA